MLVKNVNEKHGRGRSARIIAERDGLVLYDAIENGKVFYLNMVRPSEIFWNEYSA